jgi:hypothetical protein
MPPQPTGREIEEWRKIVGIFDPMIRLTADQVRLLYAPRPDSASDEVIECLDLAEDPNRVRILLAGARGAGKTTELLRLHQKYSEGAHAFVPIYLDIATNLPADATTRRWLPLLALALRAARSTWSPPPTTADLLVRALERVKPNNDLAMRAKAALGASLRFVAGTSWKAITTTAAVAAEANTPGSGAVVATAGQTAEHALRAFLAEGKPVDDDGLRELIAAMQEDLGAIQKAAERPVLVLLDGLDKRSTVDEVVTALDEAELLFDLPAALVVSGPMQLSLDPRFAAHLLPGGFRCVVHHNLPVVHRDGARKDLGVNVLLDLFHRRWRYLRLNDPPVIPDELVGEIAQWSSGIVREFLALIDQTVRRARRNNRAVATADDVAAAVRERRMDYDRTIPTDLWDQLAEVLRHAERPKADLDELLFTNRVACYPNDGTWYRPNELLVPYLKQRSDPT